MVSTTQPYPGSPRWPLTGPPSPDSWRSLRRADQRPPTPPPGTRPRRTIVHEKSVHRNLSGFRSYLCLRKLIYFFGHRLFSAANRIDEGSSQTAPRFVESLQQHDKSRPCGNAATCPRIFRVRFTASELEPTSRRCAGAVDFRCHARRARACPDELCDGALATENTTCERTDLGCLLEQRSEEHTSELQSQ